MPRSSSSDFSFRDVESPGSALEEGPESSPTFLEFSCVRNRYTMRSFELMTMSLPPLTQFENALPHYGVRSIARESAGGARGLAWLAGGLRSAVVAMAATLILGAVDSDDTPFGQGEDFAFCLLASGGVRFAISSSWSVWAGLLWQHLSNAGISEPRRRNTALDSIGPVAGVSYAF